MADPTSSTVIVTAAAGVGLSAIAPQLDGNALFGAIIGAALIAVNQRDMKAWQRLLGLLLSIGAGYVSAAEIVTQTPITRTAPAAFIGAVLVVPVALKALEVIEKTDFASLVPGWLKRGKGE
ncbi:MAG: putative holin [Halopseudomonas sp.]|uniref:putative holin n=1 Tax=Halopseudomonas sp. TaxID=2901191 RepID=UPI00300389DD